MWEQARCVADVLPDNVHVVTHVPRTLANWSFPCKRTAGGEVVIHTPYLTQTEGAKQRKTRHFPQGAAAKLQSLERRLYTRDGKHESVRRYP